MNAMTIINMHRTNVAGDHSNDLQITGRGESGGAHSEYRVEHEGGMPVVLAFSTADRHGLTNEALLAIVADRLYGFQGGSFPCPENAEALAAVTAAIDALKRRTVRLHAKPQVVAVSENKARIRVEGEALVVGMLGFPKDALKSWGTWSKVESAVKRLDPAVTPEELGVIEGVASELGGGARNGFVEFKQAVASTRKA